VERTTLELGTSKEKAVFLGEIFGPDLLIVVIVVAVLVFGGAAIPKLAKNLGSAKSEFEKGLKESKSTDTTNETKAPEADK
jgi:TatA/E family protein of Tat protein translocase